MVVELRLRACMGRMISARLREDRFTLTIDENGRKVMTRSE